MNWELFNSLPIVGILRGFNKEQTKGIVQASLEGGLTNIEITMNTSGVEQLIPLVRELSAGKMNVGAGTVCSLADLELALKCGAEFIVTPIVQVEVITACQEQSIPIFAGAFSPTEAYEAWSLGADMVKIFPGDTLGPNYIKGLKGPLDQIKLMPTGGVDLETIAEFKKAGSSAYGIGSPLFNKQKIIAGEFSWITQQIINFKKALEV